MEALGAGEVHLVRKDSKHASSSSSSSSASSSMAPASAASLSDGGTEQVFSNYSIVYDFCASTCTLKKFVFAE